MLVQHQSHPTPCFSGVLSFEPKEERNEMRERESLRNREGQTKGKKIEGRD